MECIQLKEYVKVFQDLLDDCIHRRAVYEVVIQDVRNDQKMETNTFLRFYSNDYIRSQLADLRKFFDKDERVYRFSFIVRHLSDEQLQNKHMALFERWKLKLSDAANKSFFHKEIGFGRGFIQESEFNSYLDQVDSYVKEIRQDLLGQGHELISRQMLNFSDLRDAHKVNFLEFIDSIKK